MNSMAHTPSRYIKKRNRPNGAAVAVLVVFVVLALVTAVFAFILVRNLVNSWTITDMPGAPQIEAGAGNPGADPNAIDPGVPLQPENNPVAEPWDGVSRVNVLFMGLDYRDWEAGETARTDTMILFTMDPVTMTAGMLSIPRDLWVPIPNFDYAKINTAYYLGEIYNLPGGGPQLAMDTVQEVLGVPIQYYAQVDFNSFMRLIDEIGGVRVIPVTDLVLEEFGGTGYRTPIYAGEPVTLTGAYALSYARERYQTDGGDFDRSQRQQQVIMAIRDRILSFDMLPTLISHAPALYNELSSGIRTNLNLSELLQLVTLALRIDPANITQTAIGPGETVHVITLDGQDAYVPIPDEIRVLRDQIFTTGGSTSPIAATLNDAAANMVTEGARISIQNGTLSSGLAEQTASYLAAQGLNVAEQTNAAEVNDVCSIYIYNGKPYTLSFLASLLGVDSAHIYNNYDPNASMDLVVILGNSWANNNPMGTP
jgi:LCP family protein required for cell wall assembly